jgi:hypothetical protein
MTLTVPIKRPRIIRPEIIEIGDDIAVENVKPDKGIRTTVRGVVGKVIKTGQTRYYMTVEGATLFAFEIGRTPTATITLYGRAEFVSESLFEIGTLQGVKERLSA